MTTTYSIHAAYDHSIVAAATPTDLRETVQAVAQEYTRDSDATLRFYIHNGLGVVAAVRARAGTAYDVLHDDYRKFDCVARERRATADLPND